MAFQPLTQQQYQSAINAGYSPDTIITMEKKRKAESATKEPNYFQRVASDYSKAGQDITSGIQQGAQDIQGQDTSTFGGLAKAVGQDLRIGLRTAGGVASAAFAPITEAPGIKQGIQAIGTGISKIPGVSQVAQKASQVATQHPQAAKDVQNVFDIATLGVGSGAAKPVGAALSKTANVLERSGLEASQAAKNKFAQELVKPVETSAVKLDQVKRTTESGGLFKKDVVTPTPFEVQSANEVAQIPGVSPKNTFQKNFNIVRDFNSQQAQQLESDIKQYDFVIPKKEINSRLNAVGNTLSQSPLIVGDAAKMASRLIAGAKKFVEQNEGKGSGILKARKEYDSWVLDQKPKAFDAKAENAFTMANKEVRDTLNTILDENATNLGVKDSLRKQFSLYRAMENIAPKAADEANTVFGRTLQKIGKTLGTRNKLVQTLAAATGVGVFGASAAYALPLTIATGLGFLTYKAGKLVMKPEVRIAIARLLESSGNLLDPVDKAVLQSALDNYSE